MSAGILGVAIRRLFLVVGSGGAAYTTTQSGAWGDGRDSRTVLVNLQKTVSDGLNVLQGGSAAKVSCPNDGILL